MPINENDTDDTDGAHVDGSTSEKPPTDPTALDDPVTIDVTPVPSLRPGTVTAHERRRIRGDGGENVYTTSRPTSPTHEPQITRLHAPPVTRLYDRQIATLRERIADRIREWDRSRVGHGYGCPRCGGRLR